ncbi:hypothetical protein EK21DRAFT_91719 [Setomelanomma holmii]|uniref:Uncharacterized protein n=1 Tax=Setomelanomma holmii TaxID=210430 RepID=A0A9P4H475_9PLEO|nr:hypothetical protein EK21DRAFT_91719 [Setomelanomma holmii]
MDALRKDSESTDSSTALALERYTREFTTRKDDEYYWIEVHHESRLPKENVSRSRFDKPRRSTTSAERFESSKVSDKASSLLSMPGNSVSQQEAQISLMDIPAELRSMIAHHALHQAGGLMWKWAGYGANPRVVTLSCKILYAKTRGLIIRVNVIRFNVDNMHLLSTPSRWYNISSGFKKIIVTLHAAQVHIEVAVWRLTALSDAELYKIEDFKDAGKPYESENTQMRHRVESYTCMGTEVEDLVAAVQDDDRGPRKYTHINPSSKIRKLISQWKEYRSRTILVSGYDHHEELLPYKSTHIDPEFVATSVMSASTDQERAREDTEVASISTRSIEDEVGAMISLERYKNLNDDARSMNAKLTERFLTDPKFRTSVGWLLEPSSMGFDVPSLKSSTRRRSSTFPFMKLPVKFRLMIARYALSYPNGLVWRWKSEEPGKKVGTLKSQEDDSNWDSGYHDDPFTKLWLSPTKRNRRLQHSATGPQTWRIFPLEGTLRHLDDFKQYLNEADYEEVKDFVVNGI